MSILDKEYKYVHVDLVDEVYCDTDLVFSASDEETSDFYILVTKRGRKIDLTNKTITLYVYKPDYNYTDLKLTYSRDTNLIYCNLPYVFKDIVGDYNAQIFIEDTNGEKIMSRNSFTYKVKRDILYNSKHPIDVPSTGGGSGSGGTGGGSTPVVTPLTITFTASPSVIEINVPTPITLTWSYSDKITSQTINGVQIDSALRKSTEIVSTSSTYTLNAIKEGATTQTSKSIRITAISPIYYGTFTDTITADEVKLQNKLIESKGTKTITLSYTDKRVFYAYPKSYGVLDSIKDRNGFEYISDFNREELTINDVAYYIYKIKNKATVTEIRYTFSF